MKLVREYELLDYCSNPITEEEEKKKNKMIKIFFVRVEFSINTEKEVIALIYHL